MLGRGLLGIYLSVLVLLPIAALLAKSSTGGTTHFWREISNPEAFAAIKLTLIVSAIVVAINALFGTLIAWVLVRDEFPGKRIVGALIDLPFALPTIVAGLVLLALYGKGGPVGIDITFTRASVGLALLFVTLPFVVRSVQPVLLELDRSVEEAASSLGAGSLTIFRRIVLPALAPAIISGVALSFARAVGEFGSLVLITGNLPFKTEVGSVYVFGQIQDENLPRGRRRFGPAADLRTDRACHDDPALTHRFQDVSASQASSLPARLSQPAKFTTQRTDGWVSGRARRLSLRWWLSAI